MNIQAKTWREVRDLLNQAEDQHLDAPIDIVGEGFYRANCTIDVLKEDMYQDDEYLMSESELSEDFKKPDKPVYTKGAFLIVPDN